MKMVCNINFIFCFFALFCFVLFAYVSLVFSFCCYFYYILLAACLPHDDQLTDYPDAVQYRDPFFMGFFAGITVEAPNVVIEINGHTLKQSQAFYYQQIWFQIMELANQSFMSGFLFLQFLWIVVQKLIAICNFAIVIDYGQIEIATDKQQFLTLFDTGRYLHPCTNFVFRFLASLFLYFLF